MNDAADLADRHRKDGNRGHFHRIGGRHQRKAADQKENPRYFLTDLTGCRRNDFLPSHKITFQQTGDTD